MNLTLLIMAAGMGKRFGGLKQFYPFGPGGETLLEYSIFDALKAGFNRFICVIRPELEEIFHTTILTKIPKTLDLQCVFQRIDELPKNVSFPAHREKPWGTGHTIWSTRHLVQSTPFAVINADDFYGYSAFQLLADFFKSPTRTHSHANVTFPLKVTVSPHGSVSRGVCTVNSKNEITAIEERHNIYLQPNHSIVELNADKQVTHNFTGNEPVSINCWGFQPTILTHIEKAVTDFFQNHKLTTSEECLLPEIINTLIQANEVKVQALPCNDQWTGVTYTQDVPAVKTMLLQRTKDRIYPSSLWNKIVDCSYETRL